MTLVTPPSWLQAGTYPAESDRLNAQALYATTGIIGSGSLAVTQNSPAGMSVRVASGWAAIVGTTQANMGTYTTYNDALAVLTITTANPTNPRIDRIVVTVRDSYYSGAFNDVIFQVLAGTPAGSPTAPAVPANSISLATILVGAAVTSIVTANITDTRVATTTNLAVGDITEIQGGTGITVSSGTGPIPSVAINTAVTADLTTAQTLTNKNLTSGTNTFPSSLVTLTGAQALTNKDLTTSNTFPTSLATLTGTQALTNKDLTSGNTFPTSLVTLTGSQALTNKDLTTSNTFPSSLATLTGSQVLSNKDLTAGTNTFPSTLATLTGTQTLTNKTLTSPNLNDPKLNLSINPNTATTYTFILADNGKLVTSNNASAQTLSIPTNGAVAFPTGTQISVAWITGAGQPTINAVTSGTTSVLSTGATANAPKLRAVNSVATCIKIADDIWLVTGDIA
jgi:hypothetical protein